MGRRADPRVSRGLLVLPDNLLLRAKRERSPVSLAKYAPMSGRQLSTIQVEGGRRQLWVPDSKIPCELILSEFPPIAGISSAAPPHHRAGRAQHTAAPNRNSEDYVSGHPNAEW